MGKRNSHQNWKVIREQTGEWFYIEFIKLHCWLSEHHCSGGGEAGAVLDGGGGHRGVRGAQEDPAPPWPPDGRGGQVRGDWGHAARGHLVRGQGRRGMVSDLWSEPSDKVSHALGMADTVAGWWETGSGTPSSGSQSSRPGGSRSWLTTRWWRKVRFMFWSFVMDI